MASYTDSFTGSAATQLSTYNAGWSSTVPPGRTQAVLDGGGHASPFAAANYWDTYDSGNRPLAGTGNTFAVANIRPFTRPASNWTYGIFIHGTSPSLQQCYAAEIRIDGGGTNLDQILLRKWSGGTASTLATYNVGAQIAGGSTVRIEEWVDTTGVYSNLTVYLNGTPIISYQDVFGLYYTNGAGYPGLFFLGAGSSPFPTIDDMTAGDFSPPAVDWETAYPLESEDFGVSFGSAYIETAVPQESEAFTVGLAASYVETPLPRESETASAGVAAPYVETTLVGEADTIKLIAVDQAVEALVVSEAEDVARTIPEVVAEVATAADALSTGAAKSGVSVETVVSVDAEPSSQAAGAGIVEGAFLGEGSDGAQQTTKLGRIDDNALALEASVSKQLALSSSIEGPTAGDAVSIGPGILKVAYRDGALAFDSVNGRPPASIDHVFPTTWRTVRFVMTAGDAPDVAISPTSPGDALNPSSWFVTGFSPIFVVQIDSLTFDVSVTEQLPSHLHTVGVGMNGLVVHGVPRFQTVQMIGLTWNEVFAPSGQVAQKRQLSIDIANPPTFRAGSSGIGGTLVVRGGDYATVTGTELVRKLLLRRLSTPAGGFYHLPGYGLGLLSNKDLFHPNDLVKLRAEIERQCRLEPEVVAVRAHVTLDVRGVVQLAVAATTSTGDVVQVNSVLGLGAGA